MYAYHASMLAGSIVASEVLWTAIRNSSAPWICGRLGWQVAER